MSISPSLPQDEKPISDRVRLHPSWKRDLLQEFDKPYMQELRTFLQSQLRAHKKIFPPGESIFNALNATPLDEVKVVILGQDPYHGLGQAHGLCFSVQKGVQPPPSLQNIFKELASDIGITVPTHGCLDAWAKQGVLLLNAVLTVEMSKPGSHQGRGWETFTDRIVELLNARAKPLVFMLWGSYAIKKGAFIDDKRHLVLKAPHPSPLSASRGFFGSRHFSQANEFLQQHGQKPIDWRLS